MSLRDQIFEVDDIERESETVPEWGGVTLELRGMSGDMFTRISKGSGAASGKVDLPKMYSSMMIYGVFDPETGEPVFSAGDAEQLRQRSMQVMERLTTILNRLSGMGKNEDEVEEVGKDSSSTDETDTS